MGSIRVGKAEAPFQLFLQNPVLGSQMFVLQQQLLIHRGIILRTACCRAI